MTNANAALASGFHEVDAKSAPTSLDINTPFSYTFHAFSNPFVGDMIQELNQEDSLRGLLDPGWQESNADKAYFSNSYRPNSTALIKVDSSPREIEVDLGQSYSDYHWELFFFTPLTIAVHLSKAQRFAEAQRWFHYIFDPRSRDSSTDPKRFWKFLAFRKDSSLTQIGDLLSLLSAKADSEEARRVVRSYHAILTNPFQPHVVARTRLVAYRYYVVMKYLDNLIAWGDHLFQQDTLESVNEATLLYVLASNILGPRPQRIPPRGQVEAKTFAQLKDLDPMGNALVELEGQFPFNLAPASSGNEARNRSPGRLRDPGLHC